MSKMEELADKIINLTKRPLPPHQQYNTILYMLTKYETENQYNYSGAMADLDSLLDEVVSFLNKKKTKKQLKNYLKWNYKEKAKNIKENDKKEDSNKKIVKLYLMNATLEEELKIQKKLHSQTIQAMASVRDCNQELRAVLQEAVNIYGKYGILVNEPSRPGKWIESAHEVLK